MYGKPKELSKEEILKKVSLLDLWRYYIPGVELNKSFKSPLRKDENPSVALFVSRSGDLLLKDFGQDITYTIWAFVMTKYGLTYIECLQTIDNDFNLNLTTKPKISKPTMEIFGIITKEEVKSKDVSKITIKKRAWSKVDEEYWSKYGLSLDFLTDRGVHPVQNYWVNDYLVYWYSQANPTYSYEFGGGIRKIYSPMAKKFKFLTNAQDYVLQGAKYLPEYADILIITKSYKDVLVLSALGYSSIAPQSESCKLDPAKVEKLKQRFTRIYLLYDNDAAGIKASNKICELYNLIPIFVPSPVKDISDYIAKHGREKTEELLKTMLYEHRQREEGFQSYQIKMC